MARLEQAHRGDTGRPAVVFVHGLGGDIFDTWVGDGATQDDCWLNWVGKETGCDTWTLTYDAALSRWIDQAMPLPDQGTQIAQLLAVHPGLQDRVLVLVGHSMGGLVIKSLIVQSQIVGDARMRGLVGRIRGVVFLATPHQGSQLASLATNVAALLRTNAQVGDMTLHDAHLRQLGAAFREQRQALKIRVAAFAETRDVVMRGRPWFGFAWTAALRKQVGVRVVDPSSSDPGLEGVTVVPLAEDHFSICKPSSRDSQVYLGLIAFLREEILEEPGSEHAAREQPRSSSHFEKEPEPARNPSKAEGLESPSLAEQVTPQGNALGLALFDIYTPACREFYVERAIDGVTSDALAVRSLWLTGHSGVGKTSLVRRYLDQHCVRPLEISMSQLGSEVTQERVARELVEAVAAATGREMRGHDLPQAIEAIISLSSTTGTLLFIDEVPTDTTSGQAVVASTIGVLLDATKRRKGGDVRFIVCSIGSPLLGPVNGKFRESFAVEEVPRWTNTELKKLLSIIQEGGGKGFTTLELNAIIEAAAGSPRYVKTLMRNLVRRQSDMELADMLQFTAAELKGL